MHVIGIDLGGTKLAAARVDERGAIHGRRVEPAPDASDAVVAAMAEQVGRLRPPDPLRWDAPVGAVGVGVAGLVRWPSELVWGPHTPGENLDLRARLGDLLGLPVVVDNDANAAMLAEARLGAARGARNAVLVTMGTGIGGGILVEGSVYRGAGFAGEIGHIQLVPDGDPCACGQVGCWETVCSGSRLDAAAREAAATEPTGLVALLAEGGSPSGRHLTAAALRGDQMAKVAVDEVGRWLGIGIANLIATLDPEVVVVGGGMAADLGMLLEPARRTVAEVLEGAAHRPITPILPAALGADAGMIGAALLAFELAQAGSADEMGLGT